MQPSVGKMSHSINNLIVEVDDRTIVKPLTAATGILTEHLAKAARQGELALCIGAGVSRAAPSDLPTAPQLATKLHEELGHHIPPKSCPDQDLLCLADAIEKIPGGAGLLQTTLRASAPFSTATPNVAHRALGALLIEGCVKTISTNWDDCIERAPTSLGAVHAIVTASDQETVMGVKVYKVHGCITRMGSLVVSSRQLADPGSWAKTEVDYTLSAGLIVFVGLGSIATYVRARIEEMLSDQSNVPERTWIVARSISPQWLDVIPALDADHMIEQDANDFLEELLRAWAKEALTRVTTLAAELETSGGLPVGAGDAVRVVINDLMSVDTETLVMSFRQAAVRWEPGDSVMTSDATRDALFALGIISQAHDFGLVGTNFIVNNRPLILVLTKGLPGATVLQGARHFLRGLLDRGEIAADGEVFVIASGQAGNLPDPGSLPSSIVDDASPNDVVDGGSGLRPQFVSAAHVIHQGAAALVADGS